MAEHSAVVGSAIRSVREARGTSLRALAATVGVSPGTLSAVERGLTPLTVTRLEQLAAALDVPAAHLLRGDPGVVEPPPAPAAAERDWRSFEGIAMDPILEAATRLFVRQGFHATSMREVAAEVGLSVAGIYHHYPSKERILVALLDVTMAEIAWRLEAARHEAARLEGGTAVESFALMVEALALFHAVRGDLAFLGASEMRGLGPAERVRVTAMRDEVQHALDRQADACLAAGAFRVGDPRVACRAIATMCTSLPSWFRLDGPLSAREVAAQYSRYALAVMGWMDRR